MIVKLEKLFIALFYLLFFTMIVN